MTYTLRYSDLEGQIRQAHIHFAQKGVNGGIVVFLARLRSILTRPVMHPPALNRGR